MDKQLDEENYEKIKVASAIEIQPDFSKLDCPEGTYHGLDNQGNDACRDILTNQVVDSETSIITDSDNEMIADSGRARITDSGRGEKILDDDQTDYVRIGILGLIGIIAAVIGVSRKKIVSGLSQIRGWNSIQKEQVRTSQYGRCNICYKKTTKWAYDHIDGDKRNNDLSNCQGLCPKCKSEKMMINI
ncbi:MAG: HNH endonuclease signature motif containing protein [Nitrosopumilaceae archaeon]